ncbi:DUF2147 domain-containing protein [Croceicoccus sediminis]|uniref:DUF2147 domain-containing protein n=1 Tax=Croceicoccus sediminis TaxID=2571150 RepID=UPI001479771D|nr:DUF2147 domain-containing protein [Croceicoccus sediminis]
MAAPATARGQQAEGSNPILGVWQNPDGTVEVRTEYCGRNLCGVVVTASPKAQEDARRAGVANLVGTDLLQSFVRVDSTAWSGTAFVPDMNIHVAAHISLIDADHLKISGCEFGGLVCKSQTWSKVD